MINEFVQLTEEAVDEGYERGISMFMENLEEDLAVNDVITEAGDIDNIISEMFTAEGFTTEEVISEEEIDEEKVDALYDEFKKQGLV